MKWSKLRTNFHEPGNCFALAQEVPRRQGVGDGWPEVWQRERHQDAKLVDKICKFLDEDCHESLLTIAKQSEEAESTGHRVTHDNLNMRKVCSKGSQ